MIDNRWFKRQTPVEELRPAFGVFIDISMNLRDKWRIQQAVL
jgi:hypothetical protein